LVEEGIGCKENRFAILIYELKFMANLLTLQCYKKTNGGDQVRARGDQTPANLITVQKPNPRYKGDGLPGAGSSKYMLRI
jgi:hypothetical protein